MTILPVGAPTTQLPPIAKIKHRSATDLQAALRYLGVLYNPEVRPNRDSYRRSLASGCRITSPSVHDQHVRRRSDSVQSPSWHVDAIRADSFERSYAIRWLTALVARADQLEVDDAEREVIVQDAASLLAICAGTAAAGTRSRVFAFTSDAPEDGSDIKVQLTDLPLDNQDYSSVGAQTWGGACLLADLIVQSPSDFGLGAAHGRPLRVLELGSGTGLVGLTVGKLLQSKRTATELVLTDYHPTVLENLRSNTAVNFPAEGSPVAVSVHRLDWSSFSSSPPLHLSPSFDTPFDIIFGADIVYELEHATWIKSCVEALMRTATPESLTAFVSSCDQQPNPQFHLVIPLRATHAAEAQTVERVFPFAGSVRGGTDSPPEGTAVQRSLAVVGKEVVLCEDMARGSGSDVEYIHYTIAWV